MMTIICGVDEAGRGPLAGAVYAAAVILDPMRPISGLADSKKLTARRRKQLAGVIRDQARAWNVASASVEEIDALNILQASLLAMQRAVVGLRLKPTLVLIDGIHCPELDIATRAVVRGDSTEPAISAASILAKTARDADMLQLHANHPGYGFDRNMGYPTASHLDALRRLGPSNVHRKTFAPVRKVSTGKI